MLLLDTDIFVDIFRGFLPALHWFEGHDNDTELLVPGYVVMELLQGCRNRDEEARVQRDIAAFGVVWPSPTECDQALELFVRYRLTHRIGLLDALIAQTAISLELPLHTFNQKHYWFIDSLKTIQPYNRQA